MKDEEASALRLTFAVDRIEEGIAVCICDTCADGTPYGGSGAGELWTLSVPMAEMEKIEGGPVREGDIFDAHWNGSALSDFRLRADLRRQRMNGNGKRLHRLFHRNHGENQK